MTKLSQIIAIEKDVKTKAAQELQQALALLAHADGLAGLSRTYQPHNDEDTDRPPAETKFVQTRVGDVLSQLGPAVIRQLDIEATRDTANTVAKADVTVGGHVLMKDAPVEYLLFLEKWLTAVHQLVERIPALDSSERWKHSDQEGLHITDPVQTQRTKQVMRHYVAYEATKEHPAQVSVYNDNVPVGTWTTVKKSGALPATEQRQLLERVEDLEKAVKQARQEANGTEVKDVKPGDTIFAWLFES